jgi:hypothetical protein
MSNLFDGCLIWFCFSLFVLISQPAWNRNALGLSKHTLLSVILLFMGRCYFFCVILASMALLAQWSVVLLSFVEPTNTDDDEPIQMFSETHRHRTVCCHARARAVRNSIFRPIEYLRCFFFRYISDDAHDC